MATGQLHLQRIRIETLYVVDRSGDLLTSFEPHMPARREAPALHLEWTDSDFVCALRRGLPDSMRSAALRVLADRWPFPDTKQPPAVSDLLRLVAGTGRWSSGPVFVVPDGLSVDPHVTAVTGENAEVLQGDFACWRESIEVEQPAFASVVDGQAVSICGSVRRSGSGVEAGVDTLEPHRRQGHGRRVVAAWGAAARREGLTAFYSTQWENAASIGIANSLNLNKIGASLWVE